jgi:hypothetical protein
MNPEAIAWQILKMPQPGELGRGAKRMSEDEMLEEAKERALQQPIGRHTYEEAVKMHLYSIRRGRAPLGQQSAEPQQKPVDSEFESQEDEEQQDMTGADKLQQQGESMRMLGQNLAQQRQPGM